MAMGERGTGQTRPYVHEAVYFDTTDQLVAVTAPLLREALARGEQVAVACGDEANRALAEALGGVDRAILLPRREIYDKAVSAVAYYRDFMQERVDAGSRGVRLVGEVDFGADATRWDEWRRFEALCNYALPPFPLWTVCAYNTATLPDAVLATAELTHPYLRRYDGRQTNPAYVHPAELLRLPDADTALVPDLEPALTVTHVTDFSELHRELAGLLGGEGVAPERVEDVVLAVHEVAGNGVRHGVPPVSVRVWLSPGRAVCCVTDRGVGFEDPFAGYLRGGGEELPERRMGLWLVRQLCDELVTARTPEGFTARLVLRL
jgi:anti-sigma regulatory factor (Ser/Thr protein kinase)